MLYYICIYGMYCLYLYHVKQNTYTMNELQLMLLMQNQGMVLKCGMTITAPNKGLGRVKKEFKKMMGLSARCSDVETLQAIGHLYAMNGKADKFNDYILKRGLEQSHGIALVMDYDTEEETA